MAVTAVCMIRVKVSIRFRVRVRISVSFSVSSGELNVFLTSRDLAVCNTRPLCDAGRVYSDTVNHSHGNLAVCMVRSSHMFLSGRRRSRASMSSAQPGWPRRSQSTSLTARLYVVCPPPPADAMTDVTQVVLLSVCLELRSEYA